MGVATSCHCLATSVDLSNVSCDLGQVLCQPVVRVYGVDFPVKPVDAEVGCARPGSSTSYSVSSATDGHCINTRLTWPSWYVCNDYVTEARAD